MSPIEVGAELATPVETTIPMYDGSGAGGAVLLPPFEVVHPPTHPGGCPVLPAKPLNDVGATPALSAFFADHCALQNVTSPAALRSPIANAPFDRNSNIIVAALADDGR